jgi:hypothetical protein
MGVVTFASEGAAFEVGQTIGRAVRHEVGQVVRKSVGQKVSWADSQRAVRQSVRLIESS